jgi:hypothetical protein
MFMSADKNHKYTTQLQAGLGLIDETKILLSIYQPGMSATQLHKVALDSGLFPNVTARRLRNITSECFAPRYLKNDIAKFIKPLSTHLPSSVFNQYLLVLTALANKILHDFITEVYWNMYSSGRDSVSRIDSKDFVSNAVREGKTRKSWSDTTIKRVSSYLIGCCADYGLLSSGRSSNRQIQTIRLEEKTLLFFLYWLHFSKLGDNSVINHEIWKLFGLAPSDIREELKRISRKGWLLVQSAGEVTRISWKFKNIEEVVNVIIES